MIRFFRQIRQQLLTDNPPDKASRAGKFSKYLLYAVGEILLVVIGILIALQVNNWNEERKSILNEREVYKRILKDLQIDEGRIKDHLVYYTEDQSMHHHIYRETQGFTVNDTAVEYGRLRTTLIFTLIIKANYSETTEEISNVRIREKLDNYFNLETHVHDAFEHIYTFKNDELKPFLSKYGINNTGELFDNLQKNYFELRENDIISYPKLKERYGTVEFDQLLFNLGIKTSWALAALQDLLAANEDLQIVLNNELNR